jgi:hypothetical protein
MEQYERLGAWVVYNSLYGKLRARKGGERGVD